MCPPLRFGSAASPQLPPRCCLREPSSYSPNAHRVARLLQLTFHSFRLFRLPASILGQRGSTSALIGWWRTRAATSRLALLETSCGRLALLETRTTQPCGTACGRSEIRVWRCEFAGPRSSHETGPSEKERLLCLRDAALSRRPAAWNRQQRGAHRRRSPSLRLCGHFCGS